MADFFSVFTTNDILTILLVSWLIFSVVRLSSHTKQANTVQTLNMAEIGEKCRELFPIDRLYFQGSEFRRGMRVKMTTVQHKIIEGEFIGVNDKDLICIRTATQIIIHQKEKIEQLHQL